MEIEKLEYREAVDILAKDAGIELKTNFQREREWGASTDIYGMYRVATEWYHTALFLDENKTALMYLLDRHISRETIEKFQLGYSHAPRDLFFHLKKNGFDEKAILDSGIFVSSSRDKFFWRIIFPIANFLWHVVAFTGRVMDTSLPKYLNSPASKIFDKSSILYWLHLAKHGASKLGYIIVVEGQMDTIMLHQAWYENTVWISGTALTAEHITIIKRFTKKIYLSLDSDSAGVNATFSSIAATMNEDMDVRIITIPNGKDPDEFIKSGGDFTTCIENALNPIDFFMKEWGTKYDTTSIIGKKQLLDEMLRYIAHITSHTERDLSLIDIAQKMNISKDALYKELRRHETSLKPVPKGVKKNAWGEIEEFHERDIAENIAWYIRSFHLSDLFSREFRYTLDDLTAVRDFDILIRVLRGEELDDTTNERLSLIELRLEDLHGESTTPVREKAFREWMTRLHTLLFLREKEHRFTEIPPEHPEYLSVYTSLLRRLKELGLSQDIMQKDSFSP